MNNYKMIGVLVGSSALIGCSGTAGDELPGASGSALAGNTYLYLRCNATGWEPSEATRLRPTSDPDVLELSFEVDEPWLLDSNDHCQLLETNQLNGWGTQQSAYHAGSLTLSVPSDATLTRGYRPIVFDYPALRRYTVVVDRSALTLAIDFEQTSVEGEWMWPLDGENGIDWVINNYIDLDPTTGAVRDYTGGARAYDGHSGVDIDISTFRDMDAGVAVRNVVAAEVVSFFDDHPDRNTSCVGDWNYVTVRTADDTLLTYGHLKRDSVVVEVGDTLAAGDIVALVGSSGCSTQPHLHLEAVDRFGNLVVPFRDGLFASPPSYEVPLGIMDIIVTDDLESSWVDPGPNITTLAAPWLLSTGASVGGGFGGDMLTIRVVQPDGNLFGEASFGPFSEPMGHTVWFWNWDLSENRVPGNWRVEYSVNDELRRSHMVNVLP